MIWPEKQSRLDEVFHPLLAQKQVRVFMLRDDLLHTGISGNKWRKLKYNIQLAWKQEARTLVTVGGFHSNHIAAVAHAGKEFGFKTVGLVQGYYNQPKSPTIFQAEELGMEIQLFDKASFQHIQNTQAKDWMQKWDRPFYVPMGGGNQLGVQGCMEIANDIHPETTHVATSCGMGGTMAGIVLGVPEHILVQGFTPFKNGGFIADEVKGFLKGFPAKQPTKFELITQYAGGKFGTLNAEMAEYIKQFYEATQIALDGVYNGKMMFGLFDLIAKDYYSVGSVITAVHTGGVQGNAGLNAKYGYSLPELH